MKRLVAVIVLIAIWLLLYSNPIINSIDNLAILTTESHLPSVETRNIQFLINHTKASSVLSSAPMVHCH